MEGGSLMARMSIDDSVARDPRITKLAKLLGWSKRETVGCLVLDVWPICYDQHASEVASELVNIAAERDDFADHMVSSGLASRVRGNRKIRISGAQKRIEYLESKSNAGRVGGLKSAESRRQISSTSGSTSGSTPQAPRNPSVPDLPSASVPDSASADPTVPDRERQTTPPPSEASGIPDPEREFAALRVLARLSEETGLDHTAAVEMVCARLAEADADEYDLRAVVVYCADVKGWGKPGDKHAGNLRPSTLFGSKANLDRYLSDARAEYADDIAEARAKGASS
jgi:hypothetical protein